MSFTIFFDFSRVSTVSVTWDHKTDPDLTRFFVSTILVLISCSRIAYNGQISGAVQGLDHTVKTARLILRRST